VPEGSAHVAVRYEPPEIGKATEVVGSLESSRYATGLEQREVFPAASVAVAVNDVELSSATFAGSRPAPPNAAAVPLTLEPLQSADA
jgi:hypothetical protein